MDKSYERKVLDNLHIIGKLLHKKENLGDITRDEFFFLTRIEHYKSKNPDSMGIPVTSAAKLIESSLAGTSRLLRSTEKKGYTARTHDDKDRRVVRITLTEKCRDMLSSHKSDFERRMSRALDKLGKKDTLEFIRLSDKLINILQEESL